MGDVTKYPGEAPPPPEEEKPQEAPKAPGPQALLCPIRHLVVPVKTMAGVTPQLADCTCQGPRCAWWDPVINRCAVILISAVIAEVAASKAEQGHG